MANFRNFTLQEAQCVEEPTTVVGDIDRWAELYLETGKHLMDWNDRMGVMMQRWRSDERTADGMLSSVPSEDVAPVESAQDLINRLYAQYNACR